MSERIVDGADDRHCHSQVSGLASSKGSLMFPNTWEWRHRSFPGGTYRVFVCVCVCFFVDFELGCGFGC